SGGDGIWAREFASDEALDAKRMAVDPAGAVAITGFIGGHADFAGLDLKAHGEMNYVVKLDRDGNPVSGLVFRGPDKEVVAVSPDPSNSVAVNEGDTRGTRTFVPRWDSAGTPTLDREYEGTSEQIEILYDTAGAKNGELFVVGSGFFGGGETWGE